MNIRQSDLVRDWLKTFTDTLSRTYNHATQWNEDSPPFNSDYKSSGVLYCTQDGLAVDAFVRQANVDVIMFGPVNCTPSDDNNLKQDATETLEYIKANWNIDPDLQVSVSQDVTGPFWNRQNRMYYRFGVLTYAE
jgi:hypothetical protein